MAMLVCAIFGGCSSSKKTEKWLVTKTSYYGEGGEPDGWREEVYDGNGNELEWKQYDNQGIIIYRWECTYDENGNQVGMKEYGEQDRLISKAINFYDENGNRIKEEEYYPDGDNQLKLRWVNEYGYDKNDRLITEKNYYYDNETEEVEIRSVWEYEYVYDNDGRLLTQYEYLYDRETTGKQLDGWKTYSYNTLGDEMESKLYRADGTLASLIRSETIYDENGNNIRHREVYDFTGEISMNIEQKYDENGNLIERVFYDENGDITSKLVKEYVSIQVDESNMEEEEKKIVKTSGDEKLEFMKKLYDCMENKTYERISAIISERDTMWTTIYYQDGKLVDKLSDGQALIYSFSSGVYYGQVVNGKRQGQGVQWKDDTERTNDNQPQYYYIDGTWKDNKGNGHCKLYYSTFLSSDEMKNQYVYVEGNYVNSKEDGEMRMTWLTSDGIICSGTYKVIDGIIQNNGEVDEDGTYVWVRDENDSGHYITTTYLDQHNGFPRKIYEELK